MNDWTLRDIIGHFDKCIGDIDFNELPEKGTYEYSKAIFHLAENNVFCDGVNTTRTESMIEIFNLPDVKEAICNLKAINALNEQQAKRFRFYMDLKDLCISLYNGEEIDMDVAPWNMGKDKGIYYKDIYEFIVDCSYPNISAAILRNLMEQRTKDIENYSIISRQEMLRMYVHMVKPAWNKADKTKEDHRALCNATIECGEAYKVIENHMHVGRMLGFDILTQSLYDAFDGYVEKEYQHKQIEWAIDLGKWIKENIDIANKQPDNATVDKLKDSICELCDKHVIFPVDIYMTWETIIRDIFEWDVTEEKYKEDYWME